MSFNVTRATALLLCLTTAAAAEQVSSSWIGGGTGLWSEAYNWSGYTVPDNDETRSFAVTIDGTASQRQVEISQDRTIDSLDCHGAVSLITEMQGQLDLTLLDPNGLTNHGSLRLRGSPYSQSRSFLIHGEITGAPTAQTELHNVRLADDYNNPADVTTVVKYETLFLSNLANYGTIRIEPGSDMSVTGAFNNEADLQLLAAKCTIHGDLSNSGNITGAGRIRSGAAFTNTGTVLADAGALVFDADGSITNNGTLAAAAAAALHINVPADVNNAGTLQAVSGGAVTFDGGVVNEAGASVSLLGGTLAADSVTQLPDADFTGFGTILADVSIEPAAQIDLTGDTDIIGDVNVPDGATLTISDGRTLITGRTNCAGTIHLAGGSVIFQGGCDCADCNIIHEAAADRNHFDINTDGTVNLEDFSTFADNWLWQATWY